MDLPPAHVVRDEMQNRRLIVIGLIKGKVVNCSRQFLVFFALKLTQMSKLSWFFPTVGSVFHGLNSDFIILFQLPIVTELCAFTFLLGAKF